MLKHFIGFSSVLTDAYAVGDIDLPLPAVDLARLSSRLDGGEMDLLISDGVRSECVHVSGACGALTVTRGAEGTTPTAFPKGSCVKYILTASAVATIVCATDCCATGTIVPPSPAGSQVSGGRVGAAYAGVVAFTGDLPMILTTAGLPPGITATATGSFVSLVGVPTTAGTYTVAVSAHNASGTGSISQHTIVIGA